MSGSSERDRHGRWERLLRQFPSSGLTVREFCRRRGVAEPSFYAWRRRLGNGGATPLFVPVRVAASPAAASAAGGRPGGAEDGPTGQAEPGRIDVLLGDGVTVRLVGEVPAARLASVLTVLGQGGGWSC
jgi:hypothetical protein